MLLPALLLELAILFFHVHNAFGTPVGLLLVWQPNRRLLPTVLPAAHSLMMRDPEVMEQVVHFLQAGRFAHDEARRPRFAKLVSQL